MVYPNIFELTSQTIALKKLIRITTVPSSLRTLLKGQQRFMSQYFEVIGVASKGEPLYEVEINEGIRTYAINMTRSISPFKDLKSLYKLYKFLKKEKPFIVHTHTPKAGTLGMMAAKLAGVPHRIHTIAGMPLLETKGFKRRILNSVERITYRCATLVLPNSFGLYKVIIDQNFTKPDKLRVIGNGSSNGIDVDHYDPQLVPDTIKKDLRSDLNISESDTVFIFIGRMVTDKGVNELVAAFDQLSRSNNTSILILVGPREDTLDPLTDSTETIIKENPKIKFVGVQMDIRPYVAISDVLVHPSYREGFPNVVLQGSCMGLPCIVSDINGCNEIISQNINGLIVPVKSAEKLHEAMSYVLNHPEEIKRMASNTRSNIESKYKRELIWEELLKLYQGLE